MKDEIKDKEKTGLEEWMSGEGEKEEWEFIEQKKNKIVIKNTKTERAVMATKIGDNWQITDGEKTTLTHIGDKPIERILEEYVKTGKLPKAKEAPKKDAIPKEDQKLIMSKMGFTEIESKPDLWMKKILLDEGQKEPTVLWVDFRKSDKGQYWTSNPKLDSLRLKTLGEVKALKLIGEGIIDPSEWDTGKPLETINPEGGKEFVELSWTPEEIKKEARERAEKQKWRKVEEKGDEIGGEIVEEEKKELKPKGEDIIAKIKSIVGNDVLEIFGDTGTAKSKFAMAIARNALMHGKKVYYYDTERNISPKEELGDLKYLYDPIYNELLEFATKNLPKDIDVIIIDSIGFPVLYTFAQMSQRQRGDALLGMIAILGALKVWTYKKDALAIVLNQPVSEMGVEKNAPRRPFGDKSAFAAKEIWETKSIKKSANESVFGLTSFRSRDMGYGKEIATITINNDGVKIKWKI